MCIRICVSLICDSEAAGADRERRNRKLRVRLEEQSLPKTDNCGGLSREVARGLPKDYMVIPVTRKPSRAAVVFYGTLWHLVKYADDLLWNRHKRV